MKSLKYIALSGVAVLLTALSFTSCVDGNDWETDSAYDRLFKVSKMGITTYATYAEYTWTATPNTEYYIIEISKDSLYDEIQLGESASSIVYGNDKSITKSPYTLTNLDNTTKYFLRIKSMSSEKESKWAYYTDYSFKTKSEQLMETVSPGDRTASSVVLRWVAGSAVNRIELLVDDEIVRTIQLSEEAIENGTITIEGLEDLTAYTANLYNNEVKRGYAVFQTPADVPPADHVVYLTETDSINSTLFDELAAGSYQNVTIALPANSEYRNLSKITLPDNMSFTFYGIPGENKPVISVQQFELSSKHGFIKFMNIEFVADYIDEKGNASKQNYIFNQSKGTSVGSIEFQDCIIRDYVNSPMRVQGSDTKVIDRVIFENCIIYGPTSRSYSIVHVDANKTGKIENITFNNSTVVRSGKCLVYSKETNFTSLTITNTTLYKVPGNGDYILDCASTSYGPSEGVILQNNIFGSIGGTAAKGIRCSGTINVMDSYKTTDWSTTGNAINGLLDYEGSAAKLFADPENNDFTINDNTFSGRRSCGDPRWYMPE